MARNTMQILGGPETAKIVHLPRFVSFDKRISRLVARMYARVIHL
jgi:hypothetical protein